MAVGMEAVAHAGRDPAGVATVFTSSSGDPDTIHQILETLASDQRELSPTRFHNSVHNAPAGYWSIATQSREPSTSLSHDDESFQAGLLEAARRSRDRRLGRGADRLRPALPRAARRCPPDCRAVRHRPPPDAGTHGTIACPPRHRRAPDRGRTDPDDRSAPGELRTGNPAARGLPLLAALARDAADTIVLPFGPGSADHHAVGPPCSMTRDDIATLIPHSGSMCLLDGVLSWDENTILCRTASHRLPDNPLRSNGRLAGVCGVEYAAQAMALHGGLTGGGLTSVRRLSREHPRSGLLRRAARRHLGRSDDQGGKASGGGQSSDIRLHGPCRRPDLLTGRAAVVIDAVQT